MSTTFNNKYEILKKVGQGQTAKVYLCKNLTETDKFVALKIIQKDWLKTVPNAIDQIQKEFEIQKKLDHVGINKAFEFGTNGFFVKKDGSMVTNLTYLIFDYVKGMNLFKVLEDQQSLEEEEVKFYCQNGLFPAIAYMHA